MTQHTSTTADLAIREDLKRRLGKAALAGALVPLAAVVASNPADAGFEGQTFFGDRSSFITSEVTENAQNNDLFDYGFTLHNSTPSCFGSGSGCFGPNEDFFTNPNEPLVVNWELPLFSTNGITEIQSPFGWDYEIIDIFGNVVEPVGAWEGADIDGQTSRYYNNEDGPYNEYGGAYLWDYDRDFDPVFQADNSVYDAAGGPEQFEDNAWPGGLILHWFTCDGTLNEIGGDGAGCQDDDLGFFEGPLNPVFTDAGLVEGPDNLDGFGFTAEDGDVNVPYLASWFFQEITIGDPPTPGQGQTLPTLSIPNNAPQVAEPASLALFGFGLAGLYAARRRRR